MESICSTHSVFALTYGSKYDYVTRPFAFGSMLKGLCASLSFQTDQFAFGNSLKGLCASDQIVFANRPSSLVRNSFHKPSRAQTRASVPSTECLYRVCVYRV